MLLYEVFLTDVEVPADQLVGELNGGWRVLMGTLDHERVTSEKVGVILRVLDDLQGAARSAAERFELSRLRGEAQAARLLGRRAARLLAAGAPCGERLLDGQALHLAAGPPHGRGRHAHVSDRRASSRTGPARSGRAGSPP